MENMLIKLLTILILLLNISSPKIVESSGENIKQTFYLVEEKQTSKSIKEDLTTLDNMEVAIFVIIDPNHRLNKKVIKLLESLQKDIKFSILLKEDIKMEKTYFGVKRYDENLHISGLYSIDRDKFNYIGEKNISLNLINIGSDPLETISELEKKQESMNYALLIKGENFNPSTLTYSLQELRGLPLDTGDYSYNLEGVDFIYEFFIFIGDMTMVLFITSIMIFLGAILIFKKWSNESFLERDDYNV